MLERVRCTTSNGERISEIAACMHAAMPEAELQLQDTGDHAPQLQEDSDHVLNDEISVSISSP